MMLHAGVSSSVLLLSGVGGMWQVDLVQAIRDSDLMGILCLLLILIFSILSWAVIIQKWMQFWRAFGQTKRFASRCERSKGDLYTAVGYAKQYPGSPLAQLLHEAYVEMELEGWFRGVGGQSKDERAQRVRDNLEKILSRHIETEMRHLEHNLSFLGLTANVCPFLGLLGTVWGVLAAFQMVGNTGMATIQAIAPGVSTALITTVAGLLAAIPAVVAYNILMARVQNLSSRMESFANELTTIFENVALSQD